MQILALMNVLSFGNLMENSKCNICEKDAYVYGIPIMVIENLWNIKKKKIFPILIILNRKLIRQEINIFEIDKH